MTPCFVSAGEMRRLEEQAIAGGVSEESLMDAAAAGIARVIRQFLPEPGAMVIVAGKGHNAGDAFALVPALRAAGWTVEARLAWPREEMRPLTRRKFEAAEAAGIAVQPLEADNVPAGRPLLLVDAILGTGASGGLRGRALDACRAINRLRNRHHAVTLAVDVPSGIEAGDEPDPETVVADITATIGYPKSVLAGNEAAGRAGRIAVVPLNGLPAPDDAGARDFLLTPEVLRGWLPPRPAFSRHKGQAGRIGIVAGSRGLTGAARLSATAAALAGGGLVTLFCPHDVYGVLASSCPPEVMVRPVASCREVLEFPLDALGVGPGMGPVPLPWLQALLIEDPRPVVLDADALNALAGGSWLRDGVGFAGPRLLTPHPGELKRLVQAWRPELENLPQHIQAKELAGAFSATVLAKGARSAVVEPGRPVAWNSTGHFLMAKGGMGDVLTGIAATLVGQGTGLYEAAALASWLIGYGAEVCRRRTGHEESVSASLVLEAATGDGFGALRDGVVC